MADFDPVSYMMGQKAAGGGGGGSSTLSGLTDVDISNPTDGQMLVYNADSGKWENGSGGGGFTVVNGTLDPDTDDVIIPNMTIGDFLELAQPVLVHISYEDDFEAYAFTMAITRTENNQANIRIQTLSGSMECSGPMDTPLVFTLPY